MSIDEPTDANDDGIPPDIIDDAALDAVRDLDEDAADDKDGEINASRAPLMDHLIELRKRLIVSMIALFVAFIGCFVVSIPMYNFLVIPFERSAEQAGIEPTLYFAPLEFFFTRIKLALMGGFVLTFPIIAREIYLFVSPGLYKNEKRAVFPFLLSMPVLFTAGAALVYFMIMPFLMNFVMGMEQGAGGASDAVKIELLTKVGEYLSLITTLIMAFGFAFQLPVVLVLLAMAGIIGPAGLEKNRRFAIVGIFAIAAFLTPPDPMSQIALGLTIFGLYEISILAVKIVVKKQAAEAVATAE